MLTLINFYLMEHVGNNAACKWCANCFTRKEYTINQKEQQLLQTYNIPNPIRVSSNCQKDLVKEEVKVIALHKTRQEAIASLRLTLGQPANNPNGSATKVKNRVKAGPAKTSY